MAEILQSTTEDGGVVHLSLSQRSKKNAINYRMREKLLEILEEQAAGGRARAIVLSGDGENFSAGGDIEGLLKVEPKDFRAYLQRGHKLVRALWNLEIPTVAAIEGIGVGGGIALAMCCDHVIAARSARIGFTFLKIGFVPDWGTIFTLSQRVGVTRARNIFLNAELLTANEAKDLGIVDQVVDDGEAVASALARAEKLAAMPRDAYTYTKKFLQNLPNNLEQALEFELFAQQTCFKSEDFMRSTARFLRG